MSTEMENKGRERMELSHEAVPGYKKIFYIVFGLGAAWLAAILLFWGQH